jgi:hypothetical protein
VNLTRREMADQIPMLDITKDTQSPTTFLRRSGEFIRQLKKSKAAAAVVQDAEAYQRLLDTAARADAVMNCGIRTPQTCVTRMERVPRAISVFPRPAAGRNGRGRERRPPKASPAHELLTQKISLSAACILRGRPALLITPKFAEPSADPGAPNGGVLVTLNASILNCSVMRSTGRNSL